jgi:hypothetical protein
MWMGFFEFAVSLFEHGGNFELFNVFLTCKTDCFYRGFIEFPKDHRNFGFSCEIERFRVCESLSAQLQIFFDRNFL